MTFSNLPPHISSVRTDNGHSFDRGQRRTDATERRTDAEVMAKAMGQAAPDAPAKSDPERDAVVARLKQEGRTEHDIANHMAGYDLARPRTEAYDAKLRGLAEGRVAASALQDNIEAKAEAAQRTDASDARGTVSVAASATGDGGVARVAAEGVHTGRDAFGSIVFAGEGAWGTAFEFHARGVGDGGAGTVPATGKRWLVFGSHVRVIGSFVSFLGARSLSLRAPSFCGVENDARTRHVA